jgi:hypothetical protein
MSLKKWDRQVSNRTLGGVEIKDEQEYLQFRSRENLFRNSDQTRELRTFCILPTVWTGVLRNQGSVSVHATFFNLSGSLFNSEKMYIDL